MTSIIDEFIEEARGVTVTEAAARLGINVTRANYAGPCPSCGGRDRFAISPSKQAFNCRRCGSGGKDGIGLMVLANEHQLSTRSGFLLACADALGRDVPDGGETETLEERQARLERISEQKRKNAEATAANEEQQNAFREKEINRARGIYFHATENGGEVREYLQLRTGFIVPDSVLVNLRFEPKLTYWHGKDERGFDRSIHCGLAMVAPFVTLQGRVTACHLTWIDLSRGPKYRPDLGLDDDGDPLPTKKMRGTKRGHFIPIFGRLDAERWVGGEGIENGVAIAGAEGFRDDTFYFAAGDINNLAGPADPASAFTHPTLKKADAKERLRSIRVQGAVPKPDQTADEAMPVPDHVSSLVLLADGDSEPVFTAAAMARAEKRHWRVGRAIKTWWPRKKSDFSDMLATAMGERA